MVDTELVKNGRIEIMGLHAIFNHIDTVVICFTVPYSALNSGTGKPDRIAVAMMVSPVRSFGQIALRLDGASKLTTPNN